MRHFYLLFLLIFGFSSCESNTTSETESTDQSLIDERFEKCYYQDNLAQNKCDSVLRDFLGKKYFSFLTLNKKQSFIGCDENEKLNKLAFGNENCCVPRTYDLVYDMKISGKVMYQVHMVAGSEMEFSFISPDIKEELKGYKLLLEGKLKFDVQKLSKWMQSEGMTSNNYEVQLVQAESTSDSNLNSYFWEIYFYDGVEEMLVTEINAMTGDYSTIRPITRMGD